MDECPTCGAETRPGDNFCLNCGNRLVHSTPSQLQDAPTIPWNKTDLHSVQEVINKIENPARLILHSESGEVLQEYVLDKPEMSVGRAPNSDILLSKDMLTSRLHATILYQNGQYSIRDEGSANGTFVNSLQLDEHSPCVLNDGDQIGIGEQELLFSSAQIASAIHDIESMPTVMSSSSTTSEMTYLSSSVVLHNRYHVLGVLGQGGMSTIYRAEDNNLGQRIVVVKEMKLSGLQSQEELDKVLSAFEQEALLLAKLSHPSLPSIYDHFSENDHWYIVMQYIPGETLSRRLHALPQYGKTILAAHPSSGETPSRRLHTLPDERVAVDDALNIGIKLGDVLGYLHAQTPPVIFSDLKPDNIMLTPEGNLYLIDFGIARLFETTLSDDRKFVSQGYSPPEQYESTQLTPRADIYSLGATLHEMLSGLHPAKADLNFPPLQIGHQTWARELETLVLSMLKQSEEERPPNITVVRQALQRIADLYAREQNSTADSWAPRRSSLWDIQPPFFGSREERIAAYLPNQPVPSWGQTAPAWGQPAPSWGQPAPAWDPYPTREPLPASVSHREIRLSLGVISALAWSPDGSHLAAANDQEIHLYAWPPDEDEFAFEDEPVLPLSTWSLKDLRASEEKEVTPTHEPGWVNIPTLLRGNFSEPVVILTWSPDATHIAITGEAFKSELFVLNVSSEDPPVTKGSFKSTLGSVSWSPDGNFIAAGSYAHTAVVQDIKTERKLSSKLHTGSVTAVAWSLDSSYLASASTDGSIQVWEAATGREICEYHGHSENVHEILWSSDGTYIISCGVDHTIQIWDAHTATKLRSLEGHIDSVQRITFLDQDRLLASLSRDGAVCIWRTDNWALAEKFKTNFYPVFRPSTVSFHPSVALLAKSTRYEAITVYEIDIDQVYNGASKATGIQYTNAKVVLLGDSGVGKTGLGLVLSRKGFEPTESTHGRTVWTFARRERKLDDGRKEIRETFLWDLAGQPGYRLIHQLHLSEVAIALVVFDAHSETDPFAGISHWVRALRTAQRVKGNTGAPKMLLVLARIDRGSKRVSRERIDDLIQQMGFDGYYETSAKENKNISTLATGIMKAIDWEQLPKVTSTELFQRINSFLITEKQAGRLLSTAEDLYRAFLRAGDSQVAAEDLSAEFTTGIRLLESTGLIRQLSFGNFVLLQPELLDTYASALVNAVRDEPDGLGSISEEAVHAAAFPIPGDQRIPDREQEKLLLISMVQDLLSYEIALREQGEDGPYLVFPSESTRENPALSDPENASIVFTFEGPVLNIYATLAVRLSHTGLFTKRDLWKNGIVYDVRVGGVCGMWLKTIEDGKGELTLFFEGHPSEETRFHFEEYIRVHLQRKALPESITSRRIHRCKCGFVASDQLVRMRTERNFNWFNCPVCGEYIDLRDHEERLRSVSASRIPEMDKAADIQRARATAQSTVQGKQEIKDFDVFLCYHPADRSTVIEIGERLKERGILPWLDEWELRPGLPWQRLLGQQIEQIKSAAVFVGKDGVGPWQEQELEAFLRQFVRRGCPVIPVILNEAPREPLLPLFLEGMRWVDFRQRATVQDIGPMEQLIWGITGKRLAMR